MEAGHAPGLLKTFTLLLLYLEQGAILDFSLLYYTWDDASPIVVSVCASPSLTPECLCVLEDVVPHTTPARRGGSQNSEQHTPDADPAAKRMALRQTPPQHHILWAF